MSQQHLETPQDLLRYLLRSAVTMEQHSLEALDELHSAAKDTKIKKLFSHHSEETREQISHLERVFDLFEIASYNGLVLQAQMLGATEAAALLQENLDQEVHTSEELHTALQEILA